MNVQNETLKVLERERTERLENIPLRTMNMKANFIFSLFRFHKYYNLGIAYQDIYAALDQSVGWMNQRVQMEKNQRKDVSC